MLRLRPDMWPTPIVPVELKLATPPKARRYGWKIATYPKMTSLDHPETIRYRIGEESMVHPKAKHDDSIVAGFHGLHFCEDLRSVFLYAPLFYKSDHFSPLNPRVILMRVEISGDADVASKDIPATNEREAHRIWAARFLTPTQRYVFSRSDIENQHSKL